MMARSADQGKRLGPAPRRPKRGQQQRLGAVTAAFRFAAEKRTPEYHGQQRAITLTGDRCRCRSGSRALIPGQRRRRQGVARQRVLEPDPERPVGRIRQGVGQRAALRPRRLVGADRDGPRSPPWSTRGGGASGSGSKSSPSSVGQIRHHPWSHSSEQTDEPFAGGPRQNRQNPECGMARVLAGRQCNRQWRRFDAAFRCPDVAPNNLKTAELSQKPGRYT